MYALLIIMFVLVANMIYRFSESVKHRRQAVAVKAVKESKMDKALEKYKDFDD